MNGAAREDGAAILALDLGSSSVRASLYDFGGTYVPGTETQLEHSLSYTPDGGATADPDALLNLVVRAVDETLSKAEGWEVAAVATSCFWHSLLGLDRSGRPTTPVLTWADRRSANAARMLRESLDEARVHRRTGCVFHSSYWPAKLVWLERAEPEAFAATERWISPAEYVHGRLLKETSTGTSMASATGLFDQDERRWDPELLGSLPVREEQLGRISDEPSRGLEEQWARRWPALEDVPWFRAVGDGACSNIGCGCVGEGRMALMVGTSGALRVLWKANSFEPPGNLWCYRADARRFVAGGALSNGGNLIEYLRHTLQVPDEKETEKVLSEMEPDSHGLTFLPLLAGERGPGFSDRANGVIAGLSMTSGPVEVLRAAMEAVALRFAIIATSLDETFSGEKEVVATGGGLLASGTWTQIMADVLGRPVNVSGVEEASSRGAALLALEALGEFRLEDAPQVRDLRTVEPDAARHAVYQKALERQKKLYDAVVEL